MKGFFNNRPSAHRYSYTWDTEIVLKYLDNLTPTEELSLKDLSLKLTMLIALVTGQRCQSIFLMDINCMQKTEDRFRFIIEDSIKTTKPGNKQPVLILPKYPHKSSRCVNSVLEIYLDKTLSIRKENTKLLLSYVKPHEAVSKDTVSRWIKSVLISAGIDSKVFKPHSTRSASSSAAGRASVPITSIMKAAMWKSDSVFRKFYNKPLDTEDHYAKTILN